MAKIGTLFHLLGLISGFLAVVYYSLNLKTGDDKKENMGKIMLLTQFAVTTIASIILMYALATGYFKMEYVAQYTDSKLPFLYKISAFWAGQAGSLLFWGWLVTVFAAIEVFRIRSYSGKYKSAVFLIMTLTSTFFLLITNFVTNPFVELDFIPADGMGMNPLLQNPGMLYHPPTLYLGFVGFTIPLGHAFASLFLKEKGAFWHTNTREWSMITWIFLTIGIVLGGQWAYVELGWGGYWAWDPVENASLLPWFTATAYLHSSIIYERRSKLKIWTYLLILITYELCIFGTFLTRSGVIDSVHSFGKSSLGIFFIVFMVISSVLFLFYIKKMWKELTSDQEINLLSKEGFFYIANWLFFGLMFVVFFGTTLPIFSQFFATEKTTVGIPYYNMVSMPFFMLLLIFSGIAPLLPYGKSGTKEIIKISIPSAIFMVISSIVIYIYGYTKPVPLALFAFTSFSLFTIILVGIKHMRKNGMMAIFKYRRFYGALGVHLGVVIMSYGVIASSFYNIQTDKMLKSGDKFEFGKYSMSVGNIEIAEKTNYVSVYVPVKVAKDSKYIVTMVPERRFYANNQEAFAEVSIYTKAVGDLYLILASYSKPENVVGLQVIFQPFIVWIWVGCAIMVLSGLHGIFGRRTNA